MSTKDHTKALLFINGEPPKILPAWESHGIIACTDGAFHYLKTKNFPLARLDFISGDFDSHAGWELDFPAEKFIPTPDQNKTDFEKALEILIKKGATSVDVYGGSGGEMDHFLGNLTVAARFASLLSITFFDDSSKYFFAPKSLKLEGVSGRMISLYPFPIAENVRTNGLHWDIFGDTLDQKAKIGTRNFADADCVEISFSDGDLLVFLGKKYH